MKELFYPLSDLQKVLNITNRILKREGRRMEKKGS
jgi:hypothetical protein